MKMIRWKLLDNSFVFLKVKKRKERKKKYTNEYQKELIGTLFLYLNFKRDIIFLKGHFCLHFLVHIGTMHVYIQKRKESKNNRLLLL